ncbi:MAG: phosphoserine transaminase [Acidimicrobiaceae bacterium]|nr:phosphoserine transaminase [Acidimicrobiaceae bacterium]
MPAQAPPRPETITIPAAMLPSDGRFGSGPSKFRPEAAQALAGRAVDYMGTSHRRAGVRSVVAELRSGIAELLGAPDGYEVVMGNGGATAFWDAASFGLIEQRSHHLSLGEFSSKFVAVTASAPHLEEPSVRVGDFGTCPPLEAADGVDAYCYPHNETSTGVMLEVRRPRDDDEALVLVDATSAAGGLRFDAAASDVYYFAPQKALSSDGGLWIALMSPAAVERIERLSASDRWTPAFLDLKLAVDNSRKDQTYNTPALATVFLTVEQVNWLNGNGGLEWAAGRSDRSADILYGWAEASEIAEPFVSDTAIRSRVVGTIDFDDRVDADTISAVLRANGILDTEGYRKLGRNQLRIGMFPAVEPDDIEALTVCLDYICEQLIA